MGVSGSPLARQPLYWVKAVASITNGLFGGAKKEERPVEGGRDRSFYSEGRVLFWLAVLPPM
ncbi:MAG: hypothetical protein CMJ48_09710 [Planctomycetaceae bacterium]|nr:hypothetical protein [Planctomycetaceae bacterium]